MIADATIKMADLNGRKRFEVELNGDLTPGHTVGQAVEEYLGSVGISQNGLRWNVFSRGVRLDMKERLENLPEVDSEWVVMPEVTAAAD